MTNRDGLDQAGSFFGGAGAADLDLPTRVGRYEIARELGRGGMAVVYDAYDPTLGRRVALKVLLHGPNERLRREAMAAARLRHPNVVTVHEVGENYIAMELIDGPTLAELAPTLPLDRRLAILEDVAVAVRAAHGQGVIHRDLKPGNVLVQKDGRVVLSDFGLAKLLTPDNLTADGSVIGTANYMAPEQVRGETDRVGPRSDVWSLGVMLYEMVDNHWPFDAPTIPRIYDQIVNHDPVPLPGPLGAIAARALEKDPQRRYPDAGAFAEDLARYRRGSVGGSEVEAARAPGNAGRMGRLLRRRPALLATGAIALVAMGAVAWLALFGR